MAKTRRWSAAPVVSLIGLLGIADVATAAWTMSNGFEQYAVWVTVYYRGKQARATACVPPKASVPVEPNFEPTTHTIKGDVLDSPNCLNRTRIHCSAVIQVPTYSWRGGAPLDGGLFAIVPPRTPQEPRCKWFHQ